MYNIKENRRTSIQHKQH